MKRALIRGERCQACRPCPAEQACGSTAFIRESLAEKPWVDFYRCRGCLACAVACPHRAIEEITQPCNGQRRMGW